MYLSQDRCKQLSQQRQLRVKFSQKVKILDRILTNIDKLSKNKEIARIEEDVQKLEALIEKEAA